MSRFALLWAATTYIESMRTLMRTPNPGRIKFVAHPRLLGQDRDALRTEIVAFQEHRPGDQRIMHRSGLQAAGGPTQGKSHRLDTLPDGSLLKEATAAPRDLR